MFDEYIGIDLHKAYFQACAVRGDGTRLWEGRYANDADGVAAFVTRCAGASAVAIEASSPSWAFMDRLHPQLAQVHVIDPRKTRLRAGVAAKTDKLDARRLADALRRNSVVPVYYPPPAVRELRELCRHRGSLVRLRVTLKQRIHAGLVRHGIAVPPVSDLFGAAGQRWLTTAPLTGWARVACEGDQRLLTAVMTDIAQLETAIQTRAHADPIVGALDRVRGIGPVLGLMIRAEIGDIRRFTHPAQVASYAGLVPRVIQSGRVRHTGRITREGAPWRRWALIEAAVHAGGRPDHVGRWVRRLAVAKGCGKARVAAARRLAEEVFVVWTQTLSVSAVGDYMPADRRSVNDR
jgi:transposase